MPKTAAHSTGSLAKTASRWPLRDASDSELIYVELEEALALHAEIKGLAVSEAIYNVRDMNLLQSALHRPRDAAYYGGADIAAQAATLLWGVAENQPFVDGNKRTALVVSLTFLAVNGYDTTLSQDQRVDLMYAIADGMPIETVAEVIRASLVPRPLVDDEGDQHEDDDQHEHPDEP